MKSKENNRELEIIITVSEQGTPIDEERLQMFFRDTGQKKFSELQEFVLEINRAFVRMLDLADKPRVDRAIKECPFEIIVKPKKNKKSSDSLK